MGRRRTGAKPWSTYADKGIAFIDTTIGKTRYRRSLGIDAGRTREVEKAAGAKYAELIQGRVTERHERISTALRLDELIALWLVDMESLYPKSYDTIEIHARHFVAKFSDLRAAMADNAPTAYALARLKEVSRETLNKEISTLFRFYEWAEAHGKIRPPLPDRPKVPRGMKGKRSGSQRAKPVVVTREQALAIIERLPDWAARGGSGDKSKMATAFLVRPRFLFAYETALRPSSLEKLSVPEHWRKGETALRMTDDIIKNGNGQVKDLTPEAIAILEHYAPKEGLIFGSHDCRDHLKKAAREVLGDDPRAADFSGYDFRHSRATNVLASTGDLLGVTSMLDHLRVTTTNRYVKPAREHARRALEADRKYVSQLAAKKKGSRSRKRRKPIKQGSAKEGT